MLAELEPRVGPERLLDLMLRAGPVPSSTLERRSRQRPHGIDLGPLEPRLPDALRTASGKIELAPEPIVADVERLRAVARAPAATASLVLVGRRQLRSNNSWMHNLPVLVKGKDRCTLHSTRTTPSVTGWPTASQAELSSAPGRWSPRSR